MFWDCGAFAKACDSRIKERFRIDICREFSPRYQQYGRNFTYAIFILSIGRKPSLDFLFGEPVLGGGRAESTRNASATASSLGHISAALLVANIFSTLIFLKIAKRIFKVSVGKSSLASLRMILGSIPYSINGVVNVAQIQLTVTFAALLFGSKEAALFSVAITLLNAIFILPNTIFGLYLLPKYHKLDFSVSRNVPLLNAAYAFLLGLTISVGFWKLSSLVIATLFGAEYRAATEIIEILLWTVPLRFFSTGIGAALLSERLVRWKVFCSGLGLALQVGLFILCVDEGPHEIAYAVIVGEFTVAALYASLFINYAGRPAFK
jgi:O-antigen/teichoic acid export membrane protein